MGNVIEIDPAGLNADKVYTEARGLERETVTSLFRAKRAYDCLNELGLDMQHVAVLGAVIQLSLQRMIPMDGSRPHLPDTVPDYAFHPVNALRVTRETGVPHATLRRRLEELVEHGLLEKIEGAYMPTMNAPSVIVAKLQKALFDY